MDEKQLEEIKNQEDIEIKAENNLSDEPLAPKTDSGKKIAEWAAIGLVIGFIVVIAGFFLWNKYYQKEKEAENLKAQVENLQKTNAVAENNNHAANQNIGTTVPVEDKITNIDSGSNCPSALTADDKLNMKGWKTYNNAKYGYGFMYPDDWTTEEINNDNLQFHDGNRSMVMTIRSGDFPFGLESYKLTYKKDIQIACKTASVSYYSDANPTYGSTSLAITNFKKDNIGETVIFSYKDMGASISSDIIEEFNLILKSIQYVQ